MSFSILNNIPALSAENQLNSTQMSLQKTLAQLASGSRINSGADDAAGLAIANGLEANISALNQSVQNANDGYRFSSGGGRRPGSGDHLVEPRRHACNRSFHRHGEQHAAHRPELGIHADHGRNRPHRHHHDVQRNVGVHRQHDIHLSCRMRPRTARSASASAHCPPLRLGSAARLWPEPMALRRRRL